MEKLRVIVEVLRSFKEKLLGIKVFLRKSLQKINSIKPQIYYENY